MTSLVRTVWAFVALATAGCVDLGDEPAAPEILFASMKGQNMRPQPTDPRSDAGPTTGAVVFSLADNSIAYSIELFNIDSVLRGTLNIGGSAVSGPEVATLFSSPEAPSGPRLVTPPGTRLEPGNITAPDISFDSVLTAMRAGNAYVVVYTKAFPNGAIRGQTLPPEGSPPPERYSAPMDGASERPNPVPTGATGNAYFEGNAATIRFLITVSNITGVTAAHIHRGSTAEAGPVLTTLFAPGSPTATVNGTLTSGSFTSTDGNQITMDSLLVLMRNGNAYVNVHTTANPGGEIRGQLAPANAIPPIP
jgi:hypothetical protein